MQITLDKDFGYIILIVMAAFIMNMWQAMKIGVVRKKYGIKYTDMHSDKYVEFNYAQRAHQNQLENLPFFFTLLFSASLRHTCWASGAGIL